MSSPVDQASHLRWGGPDDKTEESKGGYTKEELARARALMRSSAGAAVAIVAIEAIAYSLHVLQVWGSLVMTPAVPILLTFSGILDYEIKHEGALAWSRRWVKDDFRKSSLMLLGGVVSTFGLAIALASVSTDLNRVTIDIGAGSSLICLGIYAVKRFSW